MDIRTLQTLIQTHTVQSYLPSSQSDSRDSFNQFFLQNISQSNHMTTQSTMSIREILHGRPSVLEQTSAIATPIEASLSKDLNTIIKEAASTYQIDEKLIRSVIQAESNFNQYAVSHADRKSTRLNSSHVSISYAVFCLK